MKRITNEMVARRMMERYRSGLIRNLSCGAAQESYEDLCREAGRNAKASGPYDYRNLSEQRLDAIVEMAESMGKL